MKKVLQLKKLERLLKEGKFSYLEDLLLDISNYRPDFLIHLCWFYIETHKFEKAYQTARKLVILKDTPFNRYTYYIAMDKYNPQELENERKRLKNWFFDPLTKNSYLLYSGFIDLIQKKYTLAAKRFNDCVRSDIEIGYWGKARIFLEKNKREKALIYLKKCLNKAKEFPLILLDIGKLYGEIGKRNKSIYYLYKFNKLHPINKEGHYELGMNLIELSSKWGPLGKILGKMGAEELMVKALLDPPKLENLWIYKLLSTFFGARGLLNLSAKWNLIEQQVIYQLLSSIEKEITNTFKIPPEDIADQVNSLKRILVDKEIITEEEFSKTFAEIRETRILEEMLKLSENQDKQRKENQID